MTTTFPEVRLCGTVHICLTTHTHKHTHTDVVGLEFHLSKYQTTEGETLVVRLSAPILTRPQIPPFTGSIEVDITAEDLPGGNAEFGKFLCCISTIIMCAYLVIVHSVL